MELSKQLKNARIGQGLSQNEVATILHISRQSISKWENARGYPDLDNLILLSDIYKISIDDLLKKNRELESQIAVNDEEIKEKKRKLQKVNTGYYQNSDEGLVLLILSFVSAVIPPLGIFLPIYVIWRNNKYNSLYKTIIAVSVIIVLVSVISTYVIVSDNWFQPSSTSVYKTN